jgi:hypothetical protein
MSTQNNTVTIVTTETGAAIRPYKSNPDFAYIQLQSMEQVIDGGWLRTKKRSALLRAETKTLEAFLSVHGKTGSVPGRIVVREFVESQVPGQFTARFNKKLDYEDAIAPFVKRAGQDGEELTVGGERILRFADYDPSGQEQDIRVQHDVARADAPAVAQAAEITDEDAAF